MFREKVLRVRLFEDAEKKEAIITSVGELRRAKTRKPPRVESPYLTVDEAAVYCRLSKQTIYNNRRYITRQPGVGKLLFTKADLDVWLSTRRKKRR